MKNVKATVLASLIPLSLLALSGCSEQEANKTESEVESKMEQAEQKAKETMDSAQEKSGDAWEKTKEEAQEAGDYAEEKTDQAGDYIDDSIVTTRVKAVIFEDDNLNSMNIKVETNNGIVQLSGFVESEADIDTAENLAATVEGVKDIENDLQVKQ